MKTILLTAAALLMLFSTPVFAEENCAATDADCKKEAQVIYRCPMHPEVTSTDPKATCPKCGMELEKQTEESGKEKDAEDHSGHGH